MLAAPTPRAPSQETEALLVGMFQLMYIREPRDLQSSTRGDFDITFRALNLYSVETGGLRPITLEVLRHKQVVATQIVHVFLTT